MNRKTIRITSLILLVLVLFTACGNKWPRTSQVFDVSKDSGYLTMRFFYLEDDKKSGDSMLLKSPDGKVMLIDSGLPECSSQLINYLKKLKIKKIDYLVASHPHIDHIGGMPEVIKNFEIGKVYMSSLEYTSNTYKNFVNAVKDANLETVYLKRGDTFKFGDQIDVTVINPEPDIVIPEGRDITQDASFPNNRSVVMIMKYGDKKFMFTGDIYKEREYELVKMYGDELDCDFIKIPHHGAKTSSAPSFVEHVSPDIAVITSNLFQDKNTYDRYRENKAQVYATLADRNILVKSDGKEITVITEKDRENNDYLN